MRVVVLGAGLGGVAVAARLARLRHDVTIVDTADELPRIEGHPGSQTGLDALVGPAGAATVWWLPAVFRDLFASTGRPLQRELAFVPVDPARRYVLPDGVVLDLPTGSRAATLEAFGRAFGPAAATEWDAFITTARTRWQEVRPALVPPTGDELPAQSRPWWRRGRTGDPRRPVRDQVTDPRNRLILESYTYAAGADPRSADMELTVLPYLEHAFGAWQPVGGWPAFYGAVVRRARARGADVTTARTPTVRPRLGGPTEVDLADGTTLVADVVIDARDRSPPNVTHSSAGGAVTIFIACRTVPEQLPAETVVLASQASDAVVVGRPDLTLRPDLITICARNASNPTTPVDELAASILARTRRTGVDLDGELVAVTRAPAVGQSASRHASARPAVRGLIDDPRDASSGMLRVGTPLAGSAALPLIGLSAALVAGMIGPDGSATSRSP